MSTINLSKSLHLPTEIAGRRTAVFGISGSGKSNTAAVLVEQLLKAGEQVVMIDPKGEGWGLLSMANGKPSHFPIVIFGEPNGHIESLSESHGERLADFVVESGRSVVLSLLGFTSDQSERRFVSTFLRQLYRRKTKQGQSTRTLVVIDEAHLFVPENVRGEGAELAGAVQRIVRQGRSFGLGTLLVDQRPQDVSKRCVTQCDTLICHQLIHKTDRDALRDWVKGYDTDGRGEEFLTSLASLEPGEAWVWSPASKLFQRARVNRRQTFDSGAAPDGSAPAKSVQRAEVDLDSLRGQLAEIVDKAKADDPKELRRQIADLQKQLSDRPAVEPERIEVPVLGDEFLARLGELVSSLKNTADSVGGKVDEFRSRIAGLVHAPNPAGNNFLNNRHANPPPAAMNHKAGSVNQSGIKRHKTPQPVNKAGSSADAPRLGKAESAILRACFWLDGEVPTKQKIAFYSDYSSKSSGLDKALSNLRTAGLIAGFAITDAGVAAVGNVPQRPRGPELREWLRPKLGQAENALLDAMIEVYPQRISKTDVAARSGYSDRSSGVDKALSNLRTIEAAEGLERDGGTKAADVFFE